MYSTPEGWESRRDGDYYRCQQANQRFFLVSVDFDNPLSADEVDRTRFGLCAPLICSAQEVVQDLAPAYAKDTLTALGVVGEVTTVEAWEWPWILSVARDAGVPSRDKVSQPIDKLPTMSEQIHFFRSAVAAAAGALLLAVLMAAILEQTTAKGWLLVRVFSARGAVKELLRNSLASDSSEKSETNGNTNGASLQHGQQGAVAEVAKPPNGQHRKDNGALDLLRAVATWAVMMAHSMNYLRPTDHRTMPYGQTIANIFAGSAYRILAIELFWFVSGALALADIFELGGSEVPLSKLYGVCKRKLVGRLARTLPLICATAFWQRYGDRYVYLLRPLWYVDDTMAMTIERNGYLTLEWHKLRHSSECLHASTWSCALAMHGGTLWHVREEMIRFFFSCVLALARRALGTHFVCGLLLCASATFLTQGDVARKNKALRFAAFFGLQWTTFSLIRRLPRWMTRPAVALGLTVAGCFVSVYFVWDIPFPGTWARERPLATIPFLLPACLLVESGSSRGAFAVGPWRAVARLGFAAMMAHRSLFVFLETLNAGQPLVQSNPYEALRDPLLHAFLVSPSLFFWLLCLCAVLYCTIQRPGGILLDALGKLQLGCSISIADVLSHAYLFYFVYMAKWRLDD
eukprot:TRINITY_DN22923_c0_g1_i1.p1 TRINITY_DN22923_c0_g1~~TRINITY_DN22923_c0_g1_i1.p1  ORF type:complete len:632 (-),score=87.21 TRINITY_DN22923_c0_g1_i1:35-1930(-)